MCKSTKHIENIHTGHASSMDNSCKNSTGLDTITDNVAKKEKVALRTLQSVSSSILKGREGQCGKFIIGETGNVQVVDVKHGKNSRIGYHGLGRCGCIWTCPTCSYKILSRKKEQIERIVKNGLSDSVQIGFLTLTVPHHGFQSAEELKDLVASTYRKIRQSRKYRKMIGKIEVAPQIEIQLKGRKRSYPNVILPEYLGDIRSLEVTHGQNGWHPHLHILLFAKCSPSQLEAFSKEIFSLWSDRIKKAGYGNCSEKAYDFQSVENAGKVAEYVAKWDVANEMTDAANSKEGKGRNPSQILADIYHKKGSTKRNIALYCEFAKAFKGSPKITINGLLKDLYLVIDEDLISSFECSQMQQEQLRKELNLVGTESNEEIVHEKQVGTVVGEISPSVWTAMIKDEIRQVIRDHFEAGGIAEAVEVLNYLDIPCHLEGIAIVQTKKPNLSASSSKPTNEVNLPSSDGSGLLEYYSQLLNKNRSF